LISAFPSSTGSIVRRSLALHTRKLQYYLNLQIARTNSSHCKPIRQPGRGRGSGRAAEQRSRQAGGSTQRRINRGALPAHLPRVHVTIEPESTVCPCCNGAMHFFGEESSQRLDKSPAQYQVIVPSPQIWLPGLRGRGRPGAGASASAPDQERLSDRTSRGQRRSRQSRL
jgi:hypothetical protein